MWEDLKWFLKLPTTATKGEIMNELQTLLSQLRELAGVESTADQPAVLKALKEMRATAEKNAGLAVKFCKAIGVEKPDDEAAIDAKLTLLAKPPAHSEEEYEKLANRVQTLEADAAKREAFGPGEHVPGLRDGRARGMAQGGEEDARRAEELWPLDEDPVRESPRRERRRTDARPYQD